MRTSRKYLAQINYWPGFVDILGTLLIVTIFTVLISTMTQIYFNDQLEVKRGEISNLDDKINKLVFELGGLEKEKKEIEEKFILLTKDFKILKDKESQLEIKLSKSQYNSKMKQKELDEIISERSSLLVKLQKNNEELQRISTLNKKNEIDLFETNRNIEKLTKRLEQLSSLLIEAEEKDRNNQVIIKNLGEKLNQALAGKLQEITEYQSIFFKRIKKALGDRQDIKVSGDRFILPSEIFFESGSDIIQDNGKVQLNNIVESLLEISEKIPKKIDWVLRIDGHTDIIPINNEKFQSNWHLSSARSINIVKYFIKKGVPPFRLVAAGFGEFSPIDKNNSELAFQKNRRIEIKLTTR